jgi:hypothetical protein
MIVEGSCIPCQDMRNNSKEIFGFLGSRDTYDTYISQLFIKAWTDHAKDSSLCITIISLSLVMVMVHSSLPLTTELERCTAKTFKRCFVDD